MPKKSCPILYIEQVLYKLDRTFQTDIMYTVLGVVECRFGSSLNVNFESVDPHSENWSDPRSRVNKESQGYMYEFGKCRKFETPRSPSSDHARRNIYSVSCRYPASSLRIGRPTRSTIAPGLLDTFSCKCTGFRPIESKYLRKVCRHHFIQPMRNKNDAF